MFKTVYLTGAPASGKSSAIRLLKERISTVELWSYSTHLASYIESRNRAPIDTLDLRKQSSNIVSPKDIDAVDRLLSEFVKAHRSKSHIVIDSHPVTRELYGFRITAFTLERIRSLQLDEIWVFYTSPENTLERIEADPEGRLKISAEEARMHTYVQASVAATYGIATGRPVYLFDTSVDQAELVTQLQKRLNKEKE